MQLFFYATPIVYSVQTIPENYRWILKLNPMTYVIEGYRDILYNQQMPDVRHLLMILGLGLVLVVLGYALFNKLQKRFAEEL